MQLTWRVHGINAAPSSGHVVRAGLHATQLFLKDACIWWDVSIGKPSLVLVTATDG